MYYGEEKALQMSKSLLPCKRRKTARRNKKHIARRLRRKVKQELSQIREEDDYYEDHLDFDFHDDAAVERSYMVNDRRDMDKLGPFISWATAKAKDIPDGEKYDYIKSILPGSGFIIQDHAMSHLEWEDGFYKNPVERWWRYSQPKKPKITDEQFLKALREIVEDGRAHRCLNRAIRLFQDQNLVAYTEDIIPISSRAERFFRKVKNFKNEPRLLLGLHDIESFYKDVVKASKAPSGKAFDRSELIIDDKLIEMKERELRYLGVRIFNNRVRLYSPERNHRPYKILKKFIEEWISSDFPDYNKLDNIRIKINPAEKYYWW